MEVTKEKVREFILHDDSRFTERGLDTMAVKFGCKATDILNVIAGDQDFTLRNGVKHIYVGFDGDVPERCSTGACDASRRYS